MAAITVAAFGLVAQFISSATTTETATVSSIESNTHQEQEEKTVEGENTAQKGQEKVQENREKSTTLQSESPIDDFQSVNSGISRDLIFYFLT